MEPEENLTSEKGMSLIFVVAAIIEKGGKFLIAKRGKGKHMEGKWEFPGGKIEPGETPEECLKRELQEEFGIDTNIGNYVAESVFDYGDKKVKLCGYSATHIGGEFQLNDHDDIMWVTPNEFRQYDFAQADLPLVEEIIKKS